MAEIICADVMDGLGGLGPGSMDACLTDPPYGLNFMGKAWDHGVPGEAVWREVSRVLKPGATLLAFGGARTHHRLACAIEDAGFEIRDCLMWLYGSGFPKSLDISKAIDKAARGCPQGGADPLSPNHGNFKTQATEGKRTEGDKGQQYGAGSKWTQSGQWGDEKGRNAYTYVPVTPAAQLWSGYGTALKPAWEPVIVAMKPVDGTFAGNALKHGVAGLNVDGGRIMFATEGDKAAAAAAAAAQRSCRDQNANRTAYGNFNNGPASLEPYLANMDRGRWPANLLLDEEAAALLDAQAGDVPSGGRLTGNEPRSQGFSGVCYGEMKEARSWEPYTDGGGPSRFFYTAKASSAERGEGNHHPTVKPVDLAAYLAKLILPPDRDTPRRLLVPFCGSGSEIVGALRAGWDECVGIEMEREYVEIAARRIRDDAPLLNRVKTTGGV